MLLPYLYRSDFVCGTYTNENRKEKRNNEKDRNDRTIRTVLDCPVSIDPCGEKRVLLREKERENDVCF